MPQPLERASSGLPVVNERRERLLGFHCARSGRMPEAPTFSLALAVRRNRILLVRNAGRRAWELPGGWIEPGESAERCALRELHEESGCRAKAASLLGWIEIETATGAGGRATGAIFAAQVGGESSFTANDEISAAAWWPIHALPTDTSAIDAWLVARLASG